jgi:hypothetical protein
MALGTRMGLCQAIICKIEPDRRLVFIQLSGHALMRPASNLRTGILWDEIVSKLKTKKKEIRSSISIYNTVTFVLNYGMSW